jgi:hypothetical protein
MAVAADTTEVAAAVEVTTAEVVVAAEDRIVEAAEVTQAVVDVAEEKTYRRYFSGSKWTLSLVLILCAGDDDDLTLEFIVLDQPVRSPAPERQIRTRELDEAVLFERSVPAIPGLEQTLGGREIASRSGVGS